MSNRGYIIRLTRGNKSGTAVSKPVLSSAPTITSAQSGVYQEGVLLTCNPGVYTGTVIYRTYQWRRNGFAISGATSNTFLPTSTDVGATLSCIETVGNVAGTKTYTVTAGGAIIAASADSIPVEFTGVHADSWNARKSLVAQFNGVWNGWSNQSFASDDVATSIADLQTKFYALSRSNLSQWHRIRLDNSTPANWANYLKLQGPSAATVGITPGGVWDTGHWYGSPWDRSSSGGGVLIESLDPSNPVNISGGTQISGLRGLHFKNIIFSQQAPNTTTSARQGNSSLNISYTGYVKPDLAQTFLDASVVRVENCKIGTTFHPNNSNPLQYCYGIFSSSGCEQIDVINCTISGCQAGIVTQGVKYMRVWGNDIQQCLFDHCQNQHVASVDNINSSFGNKVLHWFRLNTIRNKPDLKEIAAAHSDANQHGTPGDVGGFQLLDELNVYYSEVTKYYDQIQWGWRADAAIPADGDQIITPDATFTFRDTPTLITDIQRSATDNAVNRVNFKTTLENFYAGNSNLWSIALIGNTNYLELSTANPGTFSTTFTGVVIKKVRLNGGTQGIYDDDSTYPMEHVKLCNMIATNTGNSTRNWNGPYYYDDRNTYVRVGQFCPAPPAGWGNLEFDANVLAQRSGSYSGISNFTYRNNVLSQVQDYIGSTAQNGTNRKIDGVYIVGNNTVTMSNNRYVGWKASTATGSKATDLLAGTFYTDVYENQYDFPYSGGLGTQQEFREAFYEQHKLKNVTDRASIGCTDPKTWPTYVAEENVTTNITMTRDLWAWGSSSMQGDQDATGVSIVQDAALQIDSSAVTAGTTGAKTHTLTNGKVFNNRGVGGYTLAQIQAKVATDASSVTGNNQFIILHIGDNGVATSMSTFDSYVAAMASMKTALSAGTRPYLLCVNTRNGINPAQVPASQFGEGISSFLPSMKEVLFREYSKTNSGKVLDFFHILRDHARDYGLQDLTYDETDLRKGYSPRGFMVSDGSHMNQHGYKVVNRYAIKPILDAVEGGTPFALRQFVIGQTPSTPQAGDIIGNLSQYGSGGTTSIDTSNTQTSYTINSTGTISRIGTEVPNRDLTRVPIKFSKTGRNSIVQPYIWVGERAAPGVSNLIEFDGYSIIGAPATRWTNHPQMTIAFRYASVAGTDGTQIKISTNITRQSTGRFDVIFGRGSDNALIFEAQVAAAGGYFNVAAGQRWFLGSIDCNTGLMKAVHLTAPGNAINVANSTNAASRLVTAAASGTETINYNFPFALGFNSNSLHYSVFGTKQSAFKMGDFWLGQGYMDVSDPAVQALFLKSDGNPATNLVNSTDGVVNGVSPILYCRGNATDWRTCNFLGTQEMAFNNWSDASQTFTEYGYLKNA